MQFALYQGKRVLPSKDLPAQCPTCGNVLRAKALTSRHVIAHWAHKAGDCDRWYETETEWHRRWKECFPPECREVVMGPHRADVRTQDDEVLEIQHSQLSSEEILEREQFYGNMTWLLDARTWDIGKRERKYMGESEAVDENGDTWSEYRVLFYPLRSTPGLHNDEVVTFRWRHPKRSWSVATKPLILDLGACSEQPRRGRLLHIGKIHWGEYVGCWGRIYLYGL